MTRISDIFRENSSSGRVVVVPCDPECIEVYYIPLRERLDQLGLTHIDVADARVKLLRIERHNKSLTVFPTRTSPTSLNRLGFLGPKYNKINAITLLSLDSFESMISPLFSPAREWPENANTLEPIDNIEDDLDVMELLEALPSCFIKDYDYGLGFTKRYQFIINVVESLSDCAELVISSDQRTGVGQDGKRFHISTEDFAHITNTVEKTVNISQETARYVNRATVRNFLAEKIGRNVTPIGTGRHPLRRRIVEIATQEETRPWVDEHEDIRDSVAYYARSIARNRPDKVASLKNDIELVALETLIERYEQMLEKNHQERYWRKFFNENPFILSLVFNCPVLTIGGQASVGGHSLAGTGETIADFLVKNSMTNNCMIIEIKTPKTELLNKRPYRGGLYAPSSDLSGAVNQVLNQKHYFEQEIPIKKTNSRLYDLESYSVSCCLIVGTLPETEEGRKSLEMFRGNSKSVGIVTFDELLEKLKMLKQVLTPPRLRPSPPLGPDDLPF